MAKCECGTERLVITGNLNNGGTKSCGCLMVEGLKERATHGMTNTPEYRAYKVAKSRCENPNNLSFKYYGGAEPPVLFKFSSFEEFYKVLGKRPSPDHSLSRLMDTGNYEEGNVLWGDHEHQQEQRRLKRESKYSQQIISLSLSHIG